MHANTTIFFTTNKLLHAHPFQITYLCEESPAFVHNTFSAIIILHSEDG